MSYQGMNYIDDIVEEVEKAIIRAAFTGEVQEIDVMGWDITVSGDMSTVVWHRKLNKHTPSYYDKE